MAHNFYAVKRGFDKKQNKEITDLIAEDWYEVAPLVKDTAMPVIKASIQKKKPKHGSLLLIKQMQKKEQRVPLIKQRKISVLNLDYHGKKLMKTFMLLQMNMQTH